MHPERCPSCFDLVKHKTVMRITALDSIIEVHYLCGAVLVIDLGANEHEWKIGCSHKAINGRGRVQ